MSDDEDKALIENDTYAIDTETVLTGASDISYKLIETMDEDKVMDQLKAKMAQVKKIIGKKKQSEYFSDFDERLDSEPIDMTKEYNILTTDNSYVTKTKMTRLYTFFVSALETDQIDLLDLKTIQTSINDHFKYLFLRKRYNDIRNNAPISINYDYDGFHVKDSIFETLDEVEKALANKAFL